jgi:hypothetical protein
MVPVQLDAPVPDDHVPLGHALQRDWARKLAPATPKVPGVQTEPPSQVPAPLRIEKVPGVHREQVAACHEVDPRGPKLPLTQPRTVPRTGRTVEKLERQAGPVPSASA